MVKVYIHGNCSSCKNALKWLSEKGIEAETLNLLETTPTDAEFRLMAEAYDGNHRKLFNTSGKLYREMGIKEKVSALTPEEIYALLQSEGMLIKRPFLLTEKGALVGFKEDQWNALLD